jgi:hypothetical protein
LSVLRSVWVFMDIPSRRVVGVFVAFSHCAASIKTKILESMILNWQK